MPNDLHQQYYLSPPVEAPPTVAQDQDFISGGNTVYTAKNILAGGLELNRFAGGFLPFAAAWTAVTANPALGNGILVARYIKIARVVIYNLHLSMGSTTTFGTGDWRFDLPLPIYITGATNSDQLPAGSAYILDSGTATYPAVVTGVTPLLLGVFTHNSATGVNANTPQVWAQNDQLRFTFIYETSQI